MSDLLVWAEHEFDLNKPDDKGVTRREHLEQVERQIGRKPEALENPVNFPVLLRHVWAAFCSLNNARSAGFSGPNPITYTEIKAWKELTGTPMLPWEIEGIKRLDQVYLRVVANG